MPRKTKLNIVTLLCFVFFAFLCIPIICTGASAEENFERSGFWGGVNLGVGFVQKSSEKDNEDGDHFFFGIEGGYTLNRHFSVIAIGKQMMNITTHGHWALVLHFNRGHLKKIFSSDPPVEDAACGEADKYRR